MIAWIWFDLKFISCECNPSEALSTSMWLWLRMTITNERPTIKIVRTRSERVRDDSLWVAGCCERHARTSNDGKSGIVGWWHQASDIIMHTKKFFRSISHRKHFAYWFSITLSFDWFLLNIPISIKGLFSISNNIFIVCTLSNWKKTFSLFTFFFLFALIRFNFGICVYLFSI